MNRIHVPIFVCLFVILHSAFAQEAIERFEVISIGNAQELTEVYTYVSETSDFPTLAFSPDGTGFAYTSKDRELTFVSLETLESIQVIDDIEIAATWLIYSADGSKLLLLNQNGAYSLLDLISENVVISHHEIESQFLASPTYDVDKYILYSRSDKLIRIRDVFTGEDILTVENINWYNISPDNQLLLTRNAELLIQIWNIATQEVIFEIQSPSSNVSTDLLYGAGFTPDGLVWINWPQYTETTSAVTWYSPIQFWDVQTRTLIDQIDGEFFYNSLQLDPTGTYILATGFNQYTMSNSCWIWGVGEKLELPCNSSGLDIIIFNADGQLMASSGGTTPNIYIRETLSGNLITTLPTQAQQYLEFSPTGQFLASIDWAIHLWAIPPERE